MNKYKLSTGVLIGAKIKEKTIEQLNNQVFMTFQKMICGPVGKVVHVRKYPR